jgi:hypothetical protein
VGTPCPNNYFVTGIRVVAQISGVCPNGSEWPSYVPPITFNGPYGLYNGGGYQDTFAVTDYCVQYQNGIPVASLVPTRLTADITANGSTTNGQVTQNVTSDRLGLIVWPA